MRNSCGNKGHRRDSRTRGTAKSSHAHTQVKLSDNLPSQCKVVRERWSARNLRFSLFVFRLKLEGKELAKYGPAKPLDQQGIDQYAEPGVQKGANYQQDPTGRRTGQGQHYSS